MYCMHAQYCVQYKYKYYKKLRIKIVVSFLCESGPWTATTTKYNIDKSRRLKYSETQLCFCIFQTPTLVYFCILLLLVQNGTENYVAHTFCG